MNRSLIFQAILLFITLVILFNIINIIISSRKEKRISDFALSKKDFDNTTFFEKITHVLWSIVHNISIILTKNNFLVKKAVKYEKYILIKEEKYKSPIDYMTVKILTVLMLLILFVVLVVFEVIPFNILLLILFIIFGAILPDLVWQLSYVKKCEKISKKLYESIIIIDDNLSKTNIYNAINKVIDSLDEAIADEYMRILTDLSYNISLYQAFKRFYERTKIPEIKIMYHLLNVEQDNLELVFSQIRSELVYVDKINSSRNSTDKILNIMKIVYIFIPIIFIVSIIIINPSYFNNIINSFIGIILLEVVFVIYIIQVFIIKLVVEAKR